MGSMGTMGTTDTMDTGSGGLYGYHGYHRFHGYRKWWLLLVPGFSFRFFHGGKKTKNAAASAAGLLRLRCSASVFVKFSTRGIFFDVGEKKNPKFCGGNFPPLVGKKAKH